MASKEVHFLPFVVTLLSDPSIFVCRPVITFVSQLSPFYSHQKSLSLFLTGSLFSTAFLIVQICIFIWLSWCSTPKCILNTPWSSQHIKESVKRIPAGFLGHTNAPSAKSLCLQHFYGMCESYIQLCHTMCVGSHSLPFKSVHVFRYTFQICSPSIPDAAEQRRAEISLLDAPLWK